MVLKFLVGLLDKEKNAIERSKIEYQNARDHRKRKLALFRQTALKEISSRHPHAAFLMNMQSNSFMAYTGRGGVLLLGVFADQIYANIEFVSDDDPLDGRLKAIDKFRRLDAAFGNILDSGSLGQLAEDERRYIEALLTKGFYIMAEVPSDAIFRGVLRKDDEVIALSDCWTTAPDGHFAKNLYERVANERKVGVKTTSHLQFRVDFLNEVGKRNYYLYNYFYDDMNKYAISQMREEFKAMLSSMLEFLHLIEDDFRKLPMTLDKAHKRIGDEGVRAAFEDLNYKGPESKGYTGFISGK